MRKNNISINLVAVLLIAVMLLPLLASCQSNFVGGKKALFSDKYKVQTLFEQRFSEKFKDYGVFIENLYGSSKVIKNEFEIKIKEFEIEEGITLNDSNYIKGISYNDNKNMEASLDLSFLGQKINADVYLGDEQLIVSMPELLEKYIVIPSGQTGQLSDKDISELFTNSDGPVTGDFTTFDENVVLSLSAFEVLIEKFFDTLKEEIPDDKVITTTEEVEYSGEKVAADVITVDLDPEDIKSIFVEFFDYIKTTEEFSELYEGLNLEDAVDDLENYDGAAKFKATYIDSLLVMWNLELGSEDSEDDTLNISYVYTSETNKAGTIDKAVLNFNFDVIKFAIELEGNSASDTYSMTLFDDSDTAIAEISMAFTEEETIEVVADYRGVTFQITMDLEITENSLDIASAVEASGEYSADTLKFELNATTEIIDSYEFKTPDIDDENSFVISDEDDFADFLLEIDTTEFGQVIGELFGLVQDGTTREIEFLDDYEVNTNGALLVETYADVYDEDFIFEAIGDSGTYVSYMVYEDQVIYYCFEGLTDNEQEYYFDGEQWYDVNSAENTLTAMTDVYIYLPELIFLDEAEFHESNKVYVDGVEYTSEMYYFPSFETYLHFMFEDEGDTVLAGDDYDIYKLSLTDDETLSEYFDMISSYTVE